MLQLLMLLQSGFPLAESVKVKVYDPGGVASDVPIVRVPFPTLTLMLESKPEISHVNIVP